MSVTDPHRDVGSPRAGEVAELMREVVARLAAAGVPGPQHDARVLVEHVAEVVGEPTGAGAATLEELVARRAAREPLQLVIGRTWFRTLELRCAPGVFIPRPETEIVAGLAIDAARSAFERGGDGPTRVVDACTGSGAIACSLAAEVDGVEVVAGDISLDAVALARRNASRLMDGEAGVPAPRRSTLRVVASDLLDGVDATWCGHLDVLVANPPYLPSADRGSWEPEVAHHDPHDALVGGADGHELVDALLELASTWLRPWGSVVVEIDERRAADVLASAAAVGLVDARIEPDLTGAPRVMVARRSP